MEDDAALLTRVRAHDREALERLLTRHAGTVVRFARGMCTNAVDADDVAQEVLIAAARRLPSLESDRALRSWLFQVTRSFAMKRRRPGRSLPTTFLPDGGSEGGAGGRATEDPEREAAGREIGGVLEAAIRGLDPRYREVLLLRDVEGLSAPEVAEVLGLRLDTVKTRLHRARTQVRERVEPALSPVLSSVLSPGPRTPSCPDVVDRFSRFLEGDIGPAECEILHAHVDSCPICNGACASLRRTVALCQAARGEVSTDVSDRVKAALRVVVRGAAPPRRSARDVAKKS